MPNYRRLFWMVLASLTLLRLWFVGQFELSPDEAYYWTWSRHLDWSYYDQGPMLALVIRFFTGLAGSSSEFGVRLGAVALSVLTTWLFFELVNRLYRSLRVAWYAFLGLQTALLVSAGAILMMHDSIMICAWVAALYFFHRALHENRGWAWLAAGLALGLGGLSKYTMALFVPGLLLYLLLSPRQRVWWTRPQLYLAGLLTLVIVSPVLIWNHAHGWASFGHVGDLGAVHEPFRLHWKSFLDFLGGQLGVLTPLLAVFGLAGLVRAWRLWRRQPELAEPDLYLFCFSAPLFLFFAILSWKTNVYANWPAPAYPGLLGVLAAWAVAGMESPRFGTFKRWTLATLMVAGSLTLLAHLEVAWSVLPLKGRAQASVDRIRGWRAMALEAERLRQAHNGPRPLFMAARRYQIASELAFYMPGQPEVQLFSKEPQAQNQYRFWDQTAKRAGQDALYVCEDDWEIELIRPRFESLDLLSVYPVPAASGRAIRDIRFVLARGLKAPGGGQ